MPMPHESNSAYAAAMKGYRMISRAVTDGKIKVFGEKPMECFHTHKQLVWTLSEARERLELANGEVECASRHSDLTLQFYGESFAHACVDFPKRGIHSDRYAFVFAGKTPTQLLPRSGIKRTAARLALLERIDLRHAGPHARPLATDLIDAFEKENEAIARAHQAQLHYDAILLDEKNARKALVQAVRAMVNDVQSFYADSPRKARQVLGHADPGTARRRKARARLTGVDLDEDDLLDFDEAPTESEEPISPETEPQERTTA